jgi:hypothetical protein
VGLDQAVYSRAFACQRSQVPAPVVAGSRLFIKLAVDKFSTARGSSL